MLMPFRTVKYSRIFSFALSVAVGSMIFTVPQAMADDHALPPVNGAAAALGKFRPNRGKNAFCYAMEDNKNVAGVNIDSPVRIASVMKLMTTLWAIEDLGPNHRYETKVYFNRQTGEVHIEGSRDPFFDRDRMLMLLSDLNKAGINHASRLTSDRSFYMNLDMFEWRYTSRKRKQTQYMRTEAHVNWLHGDHALERDLQTSFNTGSWKKLQRARYQALRTREKNSVSLLPSVQFHTDKIDLAVGNPLAGKQGTEVLVADSLPLKDYLKIMNMWSLNAAADELFLSMGGPVAFKAFLQEKFGMGAEALAVYSGSGVEINTPHRLDTKMSCSSVVRLIRRLDLDLGTKYDMDLTDIMMVAGVDKGTFFSPTKALAVKSGTLLKRGYRAKNLAGVANTRDDGEVYFGIFMQTDRKSSNGIRTVLLRVFDSFGGAVAFKEAEPYIFDPLTKDMQLSPVGAKKSQMKVSINKENAALKAPLSQAKASLSIDSILESSAQKSPSSPGPSEDGQEFF
jgi:D-alanyl-D-alanine carboxypeptidase/D-alanyl-D-alanine-endopeptidase (penicillin-binding protein 4)